MNADPRPNAISPSPADAGDPDLPDVRAAQADPAAFDRIYRRYVDRVYSYAFYQLGDHHEAEDATERTFLSALAAIGRYRDDGSTFRAWLFRIAHNAIANAHRSRSRRRTETIESIAEPQAPGADPAAVVAGADRSRAVREALARIPSERRQVIVLRFVDGLSSREIGVVLGRSPGAARVLLHRALADLAAELDHADL